MNTKEDNGGGKPKADGCRLCILCLFSFNSALTGYENLKVCQNKYVVTYMEQIFHNKYVDTKNIKNVIIVKK